MVVILIAPRLLGCGLESWNKDSMKQKAWLQIGS